MAVQVQGKESIILWRCGLWWCGSLTLWRVGLGLARCCAEDEAAHLAQLDELVSEYESALGRVGVHGLAIAEAEAEDQSAAALASAATDAEEAAVEAVEEEHGEEEAKAAPEGDETSFTEEEEEEGEGGAAGLNFEEFIVFRSQHRVLLWLGGLAIPRPTVHRTGHPGCGCRSAGRSG